MPHLPINVMAEWDPEASVWVATTDDIAGFAIKADALDRLIERLPDVLLELVEGNHPEMLADRVEIPFEVHASRIGRVALSA